MSDQSNLGFFARNAHLFRNSKDDEISNLKKKVERLERENQRLNVLLSNSSGQTNDTDQKTIMD